MADIELSSALTAKEIRTRRIWLVLFLTSIVLGNILELFEVFPGRSLLDKSLTAYTIRYFTIPTGFFTAFLVFGFCYIDHTTFLLNWIFIGFWFGVLQFAWLGVLCSTIGYWGHVKYVFLKYPNPLAYKFFALSWVSTMAFYVYTVKMKRINQVLSSYVKHPKECADVILHMQKEGDRKELYEEGVNKWPFLKPLLRRLKNQCSEKK